MKDRSVLVLAIIAAVMIMLGMASADGGFSDDADAIETAADSVYMLEVYSSRKEKIAVGSGFTAFDESLLVTNYHVIDGGSYIVAISDNKEQFLIRQKCCIDKKKDIAILKFDQVPKARALEIDDNNELKRVQKVVAIGSPAGLMNTISIGNISGFYTREGKDWIQFTAPISSGSSGGALFNDEGKVIGITTATYATAQNVNMAVKIRDVIDLYNSWDKRSTTSLGTVAANNYPVLTNEEDYSSVSVWVTAQGKKYHSNPSCSKMSKPIQIDLLEAIEKGYEPCGKCYR